MALHVLMATKYKHMAAAVATEKSGDCPLFTALGIILYKNIYRLEIG
jgi:hypothetical protein